MNPDDLSRSVWADLEAGGIGEEEGRRLVEEPGPLTVARAARNVVQARGPARIVVNASGEALPFNRAVERGLIGLGGIYLILIRNDGWTLGAPRALAPVAYRLWPEAWIAYLERPSGDLRQISGEEWWAK